METSNKEIENSRNQISIDYKLLATSSSVMGIVNITPDSFYDGGIYFSLEDSIKHCELLIAEGVDIIDLGAASTRPGAADVSADEELKRLIPILDYLIKNHPEIPISVDTFHSSVAREVIKRGAAIINDISGGNFDEKMFETVAKLNVPYVLMHIQGTPKDMQLEPHYNNVVIEVYSYLSEKVSRLRALGMEKIIIDPGFGFGKTVEHNFALLKNLEKFKGLGLPILAGISRKSMINKVLKTKPENALTGTIALNTIALLNGANIIRVHDVKEAKQIIQLVQKVKSS